LIELLRIFNRKEFLSGLIGPDDIYPFAWRVRVRQALNGFCKIRLGLFVGTRKGTHAGQLEARSFMPSTNELLNLATQIGDLCCGTGLFDL
jgi:hypothetical protein